MNIGFIDTSIRSLNLGDQIIVDSVRRVFAGLFDRNFVVTLPSHAPVARFGEFGFRPEGNSDYAGLSTLSYCLLSGTNVLSGRVTSRWNLWNVRARDAMVIPNVVGVGIGAGGEYSRPTRRAAVRYRRLLSWDFVHSARDARTAQILADLGLRALDTGCATLWPLTEEHCANIPAGRAEQVVVTLTDYARHVRADRALLELASDVYDEVYFWPQGAGDSSYVVELGFGNRVKMLPPSLAAYDRYLIQNECDYFGTRLHGGIRAMQHGRRALIVAVDHRTTDMAASHRLPVVPRPALDVPGDVQQRLEGSFDTHVVVDWDSVTEFLSQFGL